MTKTSRNPDAVAIGRRIIKARGALDLTQHALAERMFGRRNARKHIKKISYLECGSFVPSVETLRRLATALDVTTDWLLGLDDADVKETGT